MTPVKFKQLQVVNRKVNCQFFIHRLAGIVSTSDGKPYFNRLDIDKFVATC